MIERLATRLALAGLVAVLIAAGDARARGDAPPPARGAARAAGGGPPPAPDVVGLWRPLDDTTRVVNIASLGRDILVISGEPAWESVGYWSGGIFVGTIRGLDERGHAVAGLEPGRLVVRAAGKDRLEARAEWPAAGGFAATWQRRPRRPARPLDRHELLPPLPEDPGAPGPDEYVYVEELPEVIERVTPEYPDSAKRAGIQGTVVVRVLVRRDGRVGDFRVIESVPGLDEVAVRAVVRWRFRPARSNGVPVPVWAAVPVRFSLERSGP